MNWDYLGFNIASYFNGKFANPQSTEAIKQLKTVGADTATIVNTNYVQNNRSSEIFAEARTESIENVEKAVVDAKNQGLDVWLKPHIDLQSGQFRGEFNPLDRQAFFRNYKSLILDYAELAQKQNVEVLTIGTELNQLTGAADKAAWEDIIQEVRQVYDGKLIYAADRGDVANISFAGSLDLIGVDPYFPLTANEDASVEQLVEAWTSTPEIAEVRELTGGRSIVDFLRETAEGYGKPLVSTELGYRSLNDTAERPFEFGTGGQPDEVEQARLYEAFFKVFSGETGENVDFFKGAQMWTFFTTEVQNNDPTGVDYTILGKQAEGVFREYSSRLGSGSPASEIPETRKIPETPETPEIPEIPEILEPLESDPGQSDISGIEFTIEDEWASGYRGGVSITNESNSTLEGWRLEFEYNGDITQVWNADIESQIENTYVISNKDYNGTIEPDDRVSFSFIGEGAVGQEPSVFNLNGETLSS